MCIYLVAPTVKLKTKQSLIGFAGRDISISFDVLYAVPSVELQNITWYYIRNISSGNSKFSFSDLQEIKNLSQRANTSTLTFSSDKYNLTISNIAQAFEDSTETDKGRYIIKATNEAGYSFNFTDLDVYGMLCVCL